jgi:hypothetical protein
MAAVRVAIISTTGLSDTEAYYFTWSRFPDWSYYDHPPLIAWIMSATTVLSRSPFFVRIGSVVCSSVFGFLVYRFATRLFASPRAGFLALLVVSIIPAFFFSPASSPTPRHRSRRFGSSISFCSTTFAITTKPGVPCCWAQ